MTAFVQGNGIGSVVPDGWHTRADAAKKVGRTVSTLKRWQDDGTYLPSGSMTIGPGKGGKKVNVWLYSDSDIDAMLRITAKMKPGRKPKNGN